MRLSDCYDVPLEVISSAHSQAFNDFLWNWFGDVRAITHGELDLTFLKGLSPGELALARELLRRNLKLRQNHIVEGVAALNDVDAVPVLRRMLDHEPDESRRLLLAGALWRLVKDPVFLSCLEHAKATGGILMSAHLKQVLWIDDERSVDLLIDLLDQRDRRVWTQALGLLNKLEMGYRCGIPARDMQHQPEYYRKHRRDRVVRDKLTEAIRNWNREPKNLFLTI